MDDYDTDPYGVRRYAREKAREMVREGFFHPRPYVAHMTAQTPSRPILAGTVEGRDTDGPSDVCDPVTLGNDTPRIPRPRTPGDDAPPIRIPRPRTPGDAYGAALFREELHTALTERYADTTVLKVPAWSLRRGDTVSLGDETGPWFGPVDLVSHPGEGGYKVWRSNGAAHVFARTSTLFVMRGDA